MSSGLDFLQLDNMGWKTGEPQSKDVYSIILLKVSTFVYVFKGSI